MTGTPEKPVSAQKIRACPICGRPTEERFKPFCSRRCADIDLSRWLTGAYAVPTDEGPEEGSSGPERLRRDP